MSGGASIVMDPVIARRRDQLYGAGRANALAALKQSLTQDHIMMIAKEGLRSSSPIVNSTTKLTFRGSQPDRTVGVSWDSSLQKLSQMQTHFEFRGDAAPVDEKLYKASMTTADYSNRQAERLPPVKHDGKINLPDMNPKYWKDRSFGQSFYASDFTGGQAIQHLDQNPAVPNSRNEMRRRNVKDLRTTHFRFGNDSSCYDTETVNSFHKNLSPSGGRLVPIENCGQSSLNARTKPEPRPSSVARKMIEDERDSAVFRQGDYNVTRPKPGLTTFTHDYDAAMKPDKSAAFVEPTRIKKGRFLQDDPTLRSQLEEEGVTLLPPIPRAEAAFAQIEATSSTLKQLFLQYDPSSSGCVSKDVLRRVVDCLLDPVPAIVLDKLVTKTHHGKDGTIDYEDFVTNFAKWKLGDAPQTTLPSQASPPSKLDNITPGVLSRGSGKSAGTAQGSPMLDSATLGKEYHTSVHFQFGTDHDPAGTIYKKDYAMEKPAVHMPTKEEPPKPSEVMHKIPGVGFEKSTKQSDYTNYSSVPSYTYQQMLKIRDLDSLKNKRRHDINNVILTCDKERDVVDRQHSLSHASYIRHHTNGAPKSLEAPQSKYRYLDSIGALPYTANIPMASETNEAYNARSNMLNTAETTSKLMDVKAEKRERVEDARREHFKFGNDGPSHLTEAQHSFSEGNLHGVNAPAAGKKNMNDPSYKHTEISGNTQDLKLDPMRPSIFEQIRMAKKSYYNNTPNPRDPLHMKLRRTLMASDPDHTGRIFRAQMNEICSQFQINVSQKAMNKLLQRCDRDGDGRVDYHQFVRDLTIEQVPQEMSAAHSVSTMRHDYKPLHQRSLTDAQLLTIKHMQKKTIEPAGSHFFHADNAFDSPFLSVSNRDFCKPEFQSV